MLAFISAPVGDGAPNRPLDVAIVQDLLDRWPDGRPKLPIDGVPTPLLFARIALFQAEVAGQRDADRQIRPGSRTFQLLQQMATPSVAPASEGADLLGRLDRTVLARALRTTFAIAAPGLDAFLSSLCADSDVTDLRWAAYMLATTLYETATTFRPVEESGRGSGRDYGAPQPFTDRRGVTVQNVYYGRGYVQLTWLANYLKLSRALGMGDTLAANPDSVLQPAIAYRVLSCGMRDGLFTGHKMADFISGSNCDYVRARQVVNALDAAPAIGANATTIEQLIRAAALGS